MARTQMRTNAQIEFIYSTLFVKYTVGVIGIVGVFPTASIAYCLLQDGGGVVGVGYSMATHAVSVGNSSNVTVWNLNTTTTKTYNNFMRHFKATCMSCSPHMSLVVAVGTKQGVVFVLNLNGKKVMLII